ncbi:MED6-domain-containing protein [Rozella allomycis CSF55]|uniref:Mediator of RNA polymerase II transcription subunit 6 n=1 Tax=Rozella allomycis (strain CSF55) TaxID=988480 RepID=A0A075ATI8_ROZAC|nr:Mediator complex, subunit Med6 domain-containing protein [Rozella allomycis CSF55]RKP20177.1 MED6-domain-containing protein [Rozella allomycis CSF55]|eukprot:EPZ31862.1 Mediator complex, subunit Med6 domain-containing protein [Rozella allomycis CSF55]
MFGLDRNNVLDYFSCSPFYDRTCNNQVLKMQTQYNDLETELQHLKQMRGIEFVLIHHQEPALFIIQKQNRSSPTSTKPLDIYMVYEGTIYQCPNAHLLLSNRILSSLYHLNKSFHLLKEIHDDEKESDKTFLESNQYTACDPDALAKFLTQNP